jgi:hypothetical protein
MLQIFEDGATYRGRMKKIASDFVPIYYAEHVRPTINDHGQNQLEYEEMISMGASTLLRGGFFLQGGKDENVIPNLFETTFC